MKRERGSRGGATILVRIDLIYMPSKYDQISQRVLKKLPFDRHQADCYIPGPFWLGTQ